MTSTQSSEEQIIPEEYQAIFNRIPENQRESFFHSYRTVEEADHHYIQIIEGIEKTLEVYSEPHRLWYLLYGRISFVATQYDELMEFWERPENKEKIEIAPFLARILTFQNQYERAIKLSKLVTDEIKPDQNLSVTNIILLFEANFTLGLAYAYTREFEMANKIISVLEELSGKYIYKKKIGEENFQDYVFIENIVKAYVAFFSGEPKKMNDVLSTIAQWVENIKDPWLQGFYYNILGISKLMSQELSAGEEALRTAYRKFETVHDLRGYSTVGANLAVSLITKGKREEGRDYLESVIGPQVRLKNYWLAVGNMLTAAKTYLDDKMEKEANEMLEWAEEITEKGDIEEPSIFSMFSYFYSRIGKLNKAELFLDRLREMSNVESDDEEADNYAKLFYNHAAAINAMAKGDLNTANEQAATGIEIADNSGYFNYALELSMVHLEVILKRFLVDQKENFLLKAVEVLKDLNPLIEMTENAYYQTLFYLLTAYLFLAMDNDSKAQENYDIAEELTLDAQETAQYDEIRLFDERYSFIRRASPTKDINNPLFKEFTENWLSEDYLPIFYTMEALRLLGNLQFEKTSLEEKKQEEKQPQMLFILGRGGTSIFSHQFKDSDVDEVLVSGFLSALTSFSQELFGGGMLTRIDQENHVLLMERISEDNILVLIVDEETYLLRKKFKKFSSELSRMQVTEYLSSEMVLTEFDPQYQIIEGLIQIIFLDEDADTIEGVMTKQESMEGEESTERGESDEQTPDDDSAVEIPDKERGEQREAEPVEIPSTQDGETQSVPQVDLTTNDEDYESSSESESPEQSIAQTPPTETSTSDQGVQEKGEKQTISEPPQSKQAVPEVNVNTISPKKETSHTEQKTTTPPTSDGQINRKQKSNKGESSESPHKKSLSNSQSVPRVNLSSSKRPNKSSQDEEKGKISDPSKVTEDSTVNTSKENEKPQKDEEESKNSEDTSIYTGKENEKSQKDEKEFKNSMDQTNTNED